MILAYLCMLIRSLIYGMSICFTGNLLDSAHPLDVLALRFLISAIVFSLLIALKVIKVDYRGKNVRPLFAAMLFEPVAYFVFETFGIQGTTTSVAGLLCALSPALTIICETPVLHEKTNAYQKLLVLLRLASGVVILIGAGNDGQNTAWGFVCMLEAVICGVMFTLFSRKSSKQFTAIEITYMATLVGAVFFNTVNITRHLVRGTITSYFTPLFSMENIIGFIFLSVLSSIMATMMNNYALGKIQASTVAAAGGLSTVVTVAADVVMNKATLYWYHYVSVTLILICSVGMMLYNGGSCVKE